MKAIKKITTLLLSAAMVFAMVITAFASTQTQQYSGANASTDGKIIISNAQAGRTYHLWQIFPMELTNGNPVYKTKDGTNNLKATPAGGTEIDGAQWFKVDGGFVTALEDASGKHPTEAEMKSDDFKAWATAYAGTETISAKADAAIINNNQSNDALVFENIPYGYYMVTVDDDPSNPTPNFKGVVTVDSTIPTATVDDKNEMPHWDDPYGKEIVAGNGKTANTSFVELNDEVGYKIDVVTRNYNDKDDEYLYRYTLIDSISSGMTYINSASNPFVLDIGDPATSNHFDITNWVTFDPANAATDPRGPQHAKGTAFITYFNVPYTTIQADTAITDWDSLLGSSYVTTDVSKAQSFRVDIPWADYTTDASGKAIVANDANYYPDGIQITLSYSAFLDPAKVTSENFNNSIDNMASFLWYQGGDADDDYQPREPKSVAPEQKAYVYSGELTVKKVDENGNVLAGAAFTLSGPTGTIIRTVTTDFELGTGADYKYWKLKDGTYTTDDPNEVDPVSGQPVFDQSKYDSLTNKYKAVEVVTTSGAGQTNSDITVAVDAATGEAKFQGLGANTYTLTESTVPAGYNKADDIEFTVSLDNVNSNNPSEFTLSTNNSNVTWDAASKSLVVTVVNQSGVELPQTGGIGTTLIYVIGGVLLVGAGVALFARRRVQKSK